MKKKEEKKAESRKQKAEREIVRSEFSLCQKTLIHLKR